MKKITFFLMAMLVSLTSFAAALGEGYEKVTDISTLAAGDKVVLYCDDASLGVTGVNGSKDAAVAATGWVEYLVEAATGGVKLKDTNANKYISLTSKNSFTYATSGSVCKVNEQGVLYITLSGSNYFLYQNGTYYRMYVDKTGNSGYKPFYVYKVEPVEVDPDATMYTVTVKSADETMGTVSGGGEYAEGKIATLEATPKAGYEFVSWSNGSTENPLKITVTENIELTATFQAQTPITIAEASKLVDATACILNEFTVTYVYKSYIHIQDASGYGMIYAGSFGLKAGDVVTGFTCSKSTYNGLPQFTPTCKLANLTVVAGEAPAVAELTTAPTGNYHQVVKLMNLKMTGSFNTSDGTTLTATCPDGKTIAIYNAKNNLAYTFVADKTYNITGDVCQYSGKIQVSAYAIEEYVAPEPCTLATAINWDDAINAEANTDKWYAVNLASAIAAGKDIELTIANPGTEAVEITAEAYANCPATEKIAGATSTIAAGATKTTTIKFDEFLADQVEVVYFHVVTKGGDLTVGAEAIEPLEIMPIEMTNLEVQDMGEFVLLQASDLSMTGISVMLGVYADGHLHEGSAVDWNGTELPIVEGNITKTVDAEKGDVYAGLVVVEFGEGKMGLDLTMYSAAVEAVEVFAEGATVVVNENTGTLEFTTTWEGYPVLVTVAGYEDVEFKEYEGAQISELTIGDDDNWYDFAVADVVAVIKDGNAVSLEGEYTSWATGTTYYVMIDGTLPEVVVPDPVKPEPVYEENTLNPFAFGLESELSDDNTTLTVTYRLNNSNATEVNVVVYNGEDIVALVPGTTTIGKNTVEVATGDLPAGVELTWAVEVKGTSVDAPTQETKMYNLYCPHGLAIDNDPESENFGRILVAEAMQGVPASGYLTSGKGAGLYVFNPSFTTDSTVYKGGNDFTRILASNGYQPWRVKISEDGRIFVSSLDLNGVVVWEVSKDLQTWTPVISGTNDATDYNIYDADGNFVAGLNCSMDVTGSGENLKLLLYSTNNKGIAFNQSGYRLDEYALGTATTWTGTPKNILEGGKLGLVHTNVEFIYDGEGGYWFGASRAGNAGQPNLVHINAEGVQDYYTEDAGLYGGDGVLVHNGMLFKGKARSSSTVGNFGVWTIGKDAEGNTTLTEKWSVSANGIGRNLNEFAVDYAENLYVVGNSGEKIIAYALPYSGTVETPAAAQYAFQLPEPMKMAGVVKRAVQNGDEVIVLTHEDDGTAHIYQVVDGKAIAEISQEGVVPVDPENKGSYLAISDIAVTEDGKLVANNYVRNQFAGTTPEAGYKVGTSYYYIWNDLAAAPAVWFTTQTTARSSHGDVGISFALKGTSTNAQVLTTAVHNNNRAVRLAKYNIIDGQYVEPNIPGGEQSNDYYEYYGLHTTAAYYKEATQGKQFQLSASPLGEGRWFMDGELVNPSEFVLPAVGEAYEASAVLTEDLGKKYNGASYVTVEDQVLMVAPFANPDGQLVGVEILNITNGLEAAQYVDMVYVDEAVAATAAATAVEVVDGGLNITLVADAAIHTWFVEMSSAPEYEVYEEEITNLVIDLDNLVLIGGPSANFQVDVYLGLGEYNRNDDTYQLLPESSIAVFGQDATFIEGYAYEVDAFTPSAKAVVRCMWNGMALEFHLTMSAAPLEATKVVVENATVEVEKYLLFGDMYDYALKMTGEWVNPEDGLTYPVLVEVPVYYPEATEPSEIMSTVTVGGWGDEDPWLGFGEGTLTITTVGNTVTATGIVQNPMAGVAIDITISGNLTTVGLENTTVTAKPVKMIQNGQLVIEKDGVQYNAQGATVK